MSKATFAKATADTAAQPPLIHSQQWSQSSNHCQKVAEKECTRLFVLDYR